MFFIKNLHTQNFLARFARQKINSIVKPVTKFTESAKVHFHEWSRRAESAGMSANSYLDSKLIVLQVQNVEYGNIVVFRVEIPRRIVAENSIRGKRSPRVHVAVGVMKPIS